MAVATMTRCDCDCGASSDAPGEQGWWFVYAYLGEDGARWTVEPWNDNSPHFYMHAAGSECVHRLLNQWFEKQREGK